MKETISSVLVLVIVTALMGWILIDFSDQHSTSSEPIQQWIEKQSDSSS